MSDQTETEFDFTQKAPFGVTVFWGLKGVGKTLTGLNAPWAPVHTIDTENSSYDYFTHQDRLIDMGLLRGPFTRTSVTNLHEIRQEIWRICGVDQQKPSNPRSSGAHYGTILVDTGGQWADWITKAEFEADKSDKLAQIVWGRVRDKLRAALIELSAHCNCLILTAHEREYKDKRSPRIAPALLEVAAMSIRLDRKPNNRVPDAEFRASRLPFFPARIEAFTFEKMLGYFGNPADWNNRVEEELIPPEPTYSPPLPEEE